MIASHRFGIQVTCFMLIVIGLILFLGKMQYHGQALESFNLHLSLDTISITSAVLVIIGIVSLMILYLGRKKYNE
jgi:hypothetical protein